MACDQDPATPGALPCDSERPLHGRLVLHGLLPTSSAPSTKEHSCVPGPEGWLSRSIETKSFSPRDSPGNYGSSFRRIPTPSTASRLLTQFSGAEGRLVAAPQQRSTDPLLMREYPATFKPLIADLNLELKNQCFRLRFT